MPLINMSGSMGADTIAEPRIDPLIARDSEVSAAMNAHLAAADPHPAYLSQSEGDARYRLASQTIPESAIDSLIARDSEVTAAINAHLAAADPHPAYLSQSEGDARYRLSSQAIPESAIDSLIARDSEVTAAINAHVGAADPHTQYLNNARGDARYRQFGPIGLNSSDFASSISECHVVSSPWAASSFITFHRPSFFYCNLGLGTDNALRIGGLSYGSNSFRIFHEGNFTEFTDARYNRALNTPAMTGNNIGLLWNQSLPGNGNMEFVNWCGAGLGEFTFYRVPNTGQPSSSNLIAKITGAGAFIQLSDSRLKSKIHPLSKGLAEILQLKPCSYYFREVKKQQLGLIAQEVAEIIPEICYAPSDEGAGDHWALDYSGLIPILIKAIQELVERIDQLERN